MLINCRVCNVSSDVVEVRELNDIKNFKERFLIIGICKRCNKQIAELVETRKSDNRTYIDKFYDCEAEKVIKREQKRVKNRTVSNDKFFKWTYGKNTETKSKNGKVKIKQYACDYRTNKSKLVKTINETTAIVSIQGKEG